MKAEKFNGIWYTFRKVRGSETGSVIKGKYHKGARMYVEVRRRKSKRMVGWFPTKADAIKFLKVGRA